MTTEGMRRCIGSARYGIESHEAPVGDFPIQPSQKDGLGRLCRTHWNQYTAGLARDRKAAAKTASAPATTVAEITPQEEKAADRAAYEETLAKVRANGGTLPAVGEPPVRSITPAPKPVRASKGRRSKEPVTAE